MDNINYIYLNNNKLIITITYKTIKNIITVVMLFLFNMLLSSSSYKILQIRIYIFYSEDNLDMAPLLISSFFISITPTLFITHCSHYIQYQAIPAAVLIFITTHHTISLFFSPQFPYLNIGILQVYLMNQQLVNLIYLLSF